MPITVLSWNICRAGTRGPNGERQDRWPLLMDVISRAALTPSDPDRPGIPDVLLLQEVHDPNRPDLLEMIAEHLPGKRLLRPDSPTGGNVVAVPQEWELRFWDTTLSHATLYGFGVATVRVPGVDFPISFCSAHLTPYSAAAAAIEMQHILGRVTRNRRIGLVGLDGNHMPRDWRLDPDPDWSQAQDHNLAGRTHPGHQPPVGDRIVGRVIHQGRLTDLAEHFALMTGDKSLCAPTGHGGIRVDWMLATRPVVPGVRNFRPLDPQGASDHWALYCELHPEHIDLSQTYDFV
ncbi:endonuclease/exonuclease/phosphatase family protein [Thermomonospora cellulosilytica]|uniref:Endonuclease/exonuclease/phosphatase n=1 Tax=Thermomonospora cellulosilytica TaxID=1411118 RepID=A0A7W3N1Q2_9ACTN|nr:endonuclease/exonuclease/phosphatase family protein [Thermomonospora cellulosilytica]MBA9005921.1 hypothetical protein [Thermomonospora cellulosilytica]